MVVNASGVPVTQDLELRARRLKERLNRQSPDNVPVSDTEISYIPRDGMHTSSNLVAHNKSRVSRVGPRSTSNNRGNN